MFLRMMEKNKNKIEAKLWWQEKEELRDMFALRVKILGGKMWMGKMSVPLNFNEFSSNWFQQKCHMWKELYALQNWES